MIDLQTKAALTVLYNEPHRKYHNLNHIRQCLVELEKLSEADNTVNFHLIEETIWWHDAVYEPKSKNNEKRTISLLWATSPKSYNAALEQMIKASDHKEESFKSASLAFSGGDKLSLEYFLDIDLSILGSEISEYSDYMMAIRDEYHFVPFDVYSQVRKYVLKSFLDKEHIYKSSYFREKYENIARKNIQLEIERWSRPI